MQHWPWEHWSSHNRKTKIHEEKKLNEVTHECDL